MKQGTLITKLTIFIFFVVILLYIIFSVLKRKTKRSNARQKISVERQHHFKVACLKGANDHGNKRCDFWEAQYS